MVRVKILLLLALILLLEPITVTFAYQPEPDYQRLASAIKKAENSLSHPYGIMTKYKHTTPKQACINTCRHYWRAWNKAGNPGTYLEYLASRYAPTNDATNDPTHLNKNWFKNVKYILNK